MCSIVYCFPVVAAGKQSVTAAYENFRQARIQSADCDRMLTQKMHTVERALVRWQARMGRLPEEGAESEQLEASLSALAGANSYSEFEGNLAARSYKAQYRQPLLQEGQGKEVSRPDDVTRQKNADDDSWRFIKMAPPPTPVQVTPTAVKIRVDLSLSSLQLPLYNREAMEKWRAPAGTITILHNTERFFLIWGASIDGSPVKLPEQSGPLLLSPPERQQ